MKVNKTEWLKNYISKNGFKSGDAAHRAFFADSSLDMRVDDYQENVIEFQDTGAYPSRGDFRRVAQGELGLYNPAFARKQGRQAVAA